jgi:DNA-binding GntR family transcriptional regulator
MPTKKPAPARPAPSGLRNAGPRYLMVAEALIADIERGRFAVGDMLPPELEIAQQYGVSRYTAREAIRKLTEMGLITRRAGIGTTVKSIATQSRYTATISDIADLVHYTKETQLKILSEEWVRIEGELEAILAEARGQRWLKFSTLRFQGKSKEPISYTEIVVHPRYERIRERIHEPGVTIYRLIEDLHGEKVSEVRQEISCVAISKQAGALLGAKPGSPALHVLRYYLGKGDELMSVSINIYPQDRFKLSTRWRLDYA